MLNIKKRKNQKGTTLVEFMMVIGLISVVVTTAIMTYGKVKTSSDVNQTYSDVNTIVSQTRNLFLQQGSYTGLDENYLEKSDVFPDNMVKPDGSIASIWGPVTAAPANAGGYPSDSFQLTYDNIPSNICNNLGSKMIGMYYQMNVESSTDVSDVVSLNSACGDDTEVSMVIWAK